MSDVFVTENFLLQCDQAVELFHRFAKSMPIIDYHCHLPPADVADDRRFENLTQIWLAGDHYKWRAMRSAGVAERFITGDATDREKFQKWAEVVPQTLRNPLYHWTHLELKRPFGVSDRLLNPQTAESVWNDCNAKLATAEFSARGVMRTMNVVLVCTTDDPIDDLKNHQRIAADKSFSIQVLPTFRPDKALAQQTPAAFNEWTEKLAEAAGVEIGDDYAKFIEALRKRHDYFHANGCRLADHGIETFFFAEYTEAEVAAAFRKLRKGDAPSPEEMTKYRTGVLLELTSMNAEKNWTQQFHYGVLRNNNSRQFKALGPDTGFDSIGDFTSGVAMAKFFDRLDGQDKLAKTIIYNINPSQNELVATMLGNFQDGKTAGKMQFGSGWWFLDQKQGMESQMNALSNLGLLSKFVGMLTDSRSLLSYTRHEYFRRILCNLLGKEMRDGLIPNDMEMVGSMVQDICYRNAAGYFGFDVPKA